MKSPFKRNEKLINELKESMESALKSFTEENLKQVEQIKSKQNKISLENEEMLTSIYELSEKNTLTEEYEKELKGLLGLILLYQEYYELICSNIKAIGNEGLNYQLKMMEGKLNQEMSLNGLTAINRPGDCINTRIHEIVRAEMTEDNTLIDTVKTVLVPGCIYKGEVIRKAKVVAYVKKRENIVW